MSTNKPCVWFFCKICEVCVSSKFLIWSHLLKTHSKRTKSDDPIKVWREVRLLSDVKVVLQRCQTSSNGSKDTRVRHLQRLRRKRPIVPTTSQIQATSSTLLNAQLDHECDLCPQKFRLRSQLYKHRHRRHKVPKPEMPCDQCDKTFIFAYQLEYHKLTHFPAWFQLSEQEQKLKRLQCRDKLRENRQLQCPHCPRKYRCEAFLKNHLRSHSSLRPYECKTCGTTYKTNFCLNVHIRNKSCTKVLLEKAIRIHQCDICHQCLKTEKGLSNHKRSQHGIIKRRERGDPTCVFCGYVAKSLHVLERHNRTHTGEKPVKCSACGTSFAANHNLRKHIRVHCQAAKKSGLAKLIQAEFRLNSVKRISQNTGKSFRCVQCGECFKRAFLLGLHEKSHGNKFKCQFCSAGFLKYSAMRFHQTRAHNDLIGGYKCNVCDRNLLTLKSLQRHYRDSHNFGPGPGPRHERIYCRRKNLACKSDIKEVDLSKILAGSTMPMPNADTVVKLESSEDVCKIDIDPEAEVTDSFSLEAGGVTFRL